VVSCGEYAKVEESDKGKGRGMDPIQAFLLGIMVAWTPSLIVLALALWDVR
jgi:hypothetical protein